MTDINEVSQKLGPQFQISHAGPPKKNRGHVCVQTLRAVSSRQQQIKPLVGINTRACSLVTHFI